MMHGMQIVTYPLGVGERVVVLVKNALETPGELPGTGLRISFFRSSHSSFIPSSAPALGEI